MYIVLFPITKSTVPKKCSSAISNQDFKISMVSLKFDRSTVLALSLWKLGVSLVLTFVPCENILALNSLSGTLGNASTLRCNLSGLCLILNA